MHTLRLTNLGFFLAFLVSLGGCRSGPERSDAMLAAPATSAAEAAPQEVEAVEDAPPALTITVEQAVAEALEGNRVVAQSRVNALIGETFEREARSAMIPQVGVRGTFSGRDQAPQANVPEFGGSISTGPKTEARVDLAVSFPIYAFGRYINAWRAAKLSRMQDEADRDTAEADIAAAVTAAAFDLLNVSRQIDVAKADEKALEQQVKDAKALFDAGRVTYSDVLDAEVQHDRTRRIRERLETLVPIRRMILNRLLGRPTEMETAVVDEPLLRAPPWSLEGMQEEALSLRPEMRAARLGIEAAERNVKSVIGGEIAELRGEAGLFATDNEFASPQEGATFAFTLDIPIYTGGARRARIRRARYQAEIARLQAEDIADEIRTDVATAYREMDESFKDIVVAARSIERSRESLRIQREKFNTGRATSLEVLQATQVLTDARFQYVASVYNYNIALRELHRARGADPRLPPLVSAPGAPEAPVPAEMEAPAGESAGTEQE
jgi:outer membrane protein